MDVIEEIGCPRSSSIYFREPEFNELAPMTSDSDLMNMFVLNLGRSITEVYVYSPQMVFSDDEENNDVENEIYLGSVVNGSLVDGGMNEESYGEGNSDGNNTDENHTDSSSDYQMSSDEDNESEEYMELVDEELEGVAHHAEDEASDSDGSDVLRSPTNLDEEDNRPNYPEFNEERDMANPRLMLGMRFPFVTAYRKLLREYHLKKGYDFTFQKNEKDRVTMVCKLECGFRAHASTVHGTGEFQLKSLKGPHKCVRTYYNSNATYGLLASKYVDKLADDNNWKLKTMKKTVRKDWIINVLDMKIYRAKRKALKLIQGSYSEQYLKLKDYCEMIMSQNPGSVALLRVERPWPNSAPMFQRIFITYSAQVRGFVCGCRPIIGLDGCFLKGPYGGQLLYAVGRDGNDQMYL